MHVVVRIVRILALLQRKTLIEIKYRTLKCLKWHYSTLRSVKKCCIVNGRRGICPLFSSPPRGIWQLQSPHPREFAIQGKKNANARGSAGGKGAGRRWDWLMHYEKINPSEWHKPVNALMECFHSRGQHLCKYIGTKESVCIRKEFNSRRIGLGHQHGRRDVMWKHSILIKRISFWSMRRDINLLLFIFRTNFPEALFFGTYFSVTRFLRKCLPLIFTLHRWLLALVTAATNFSYCSCNKKMFPLFFFFISRPRSLSPVFSLSFAGLLPTFSFALSLFLLYIPNLWAWQLI